MIGGPRLCEPLLATGLGRFTGAASRHANGARKRTSPHWRSGWVSVVFHSVVMPYLSKESRENARRVIEDAGTRATVNAPLAWLSMELGTDQAEVHLTMWPGGERRLIAQAGLHGRDVKVL